MEKKKEILLDPKKQKVRYVLLIIGGFLLVLLKIARGLCSPNIAPKI